MDDNNNIVDMSKTLDTVELDSTNLIDIIRIDVR